MIDRISFEALVKELVADLYDYAALETHPLASSIVPAGWSGSKSDYIRQLVLETIEELRPPGKDYQATAFEWRPYVILSKRFVEGKSVQDLAAQLAISDRQLRRDQHKALQALSSRLWDKVSPVMLAAAPPIEPALDELGVLRSEAGAAAGTYDIDWERIDLCRVIKSVSKTMQKRLDEEGVQLLLELPDEQVPVLTDRIILRQILISIVNFTLQHSGEAITIRVKPVEDQPEPRRVHVAVLAPESDIEPDEPGIEENSLLSSIRYWNSQIHASYAYTIQEESASKCLDLRLSLPGADQPVILVVDDQEPAISMIRRYLSRSNYMVVGTSKAEQALHLAGHLRPAVLILDIMMPVIDGWELLQSLKLNEPTAQIPVVVCSAWDEPELARSLGAALSLKKPVTQRMLLEALQQLSLPVSA